MEMERGSSKNEEDSKPSDKSTESDTNNKSTQQGASWWGSWGQEWIDTVKEKSAETLSMVKKDLNEFVEVIQGDTAEKLSETATKLDKEKEKENSQGSGGMEATTKVVKQGISKFLHSVSDLITIEPDDSTEEIITLSDDKSIASNYDRKQAKVHFIQTDPGTYCNEPEGLFNEWFETFELDDHKIEMSNLLIENTSVRAIYTQLVPNVISHNIFWQRYFYQLFLLNVEEKKRNDILARASNVSSKDDNEDEGWSEDDDDEIEVLSKSGKVLIENDGNKENRTIEEDIKLNKEKINKPAVNNKPYTTANLELTSRDTETHTEHKKQNDMNKEILLKNKSPISITKVLTSENETSDVIEINPHFDQVTEQPAQITEQPGNITEHPEQITVQPGKNIEQSAQVTEQPGKNIVQPEKNIEQVDKSLNKSCDTIDSSKDWGSNNGEQNNEKDNNKSENRISNNSIANNLRIEQSETSSVSSWLSIDDDIKVKRIKDEQVIKQDSNGNSEGKSSDNSSTVMVNKSDADDLDDFDLDLEDDVNEEELQKMVQDIKNKSTTGNLGDVDDDDWENWE